MTRLTWGAPVTPAVESGVDRVVVYPASGGSVAWTGVTDIAEQLVGGEISTQYIDGVAYCYFVNSQDFSVSIKGFHAPKMFRVCTGEVYLRNGFSLHQQPKLRFHFSYRTQIGANYKLHFVYNAMAHPTGRKYDSRTDKPTAVEHEWGVNTVPVVTTAYKPTAHIFVVSNKVSAAKLATLEDILYGTAIVDPRIPLPTEVYSLLTT